MNRITLAIEQQTYEQLVKYLLNDPDDNERAAFAFATQSFNLQGSTLNIDEWIPMDGGYLNWTSPHHIELSDKARSAVIKTAHDRSATLVEFHSHTGPWKAAFSPSDLSGFLEWVPHVMWRLPNRPYVAIVVARSGFDALAWSGDASGGHGDVVLDVDGRLRYPTGITAGGRHGR